MQTQTDFLKQLRQALNHLYDRDFLRKSPLVEQFGIGGRSDPASVLQRALQDAIEALKPEVGSPPRSEPRMVYEILLFRYIQRFSQEEVAHHIGVSERQFRREQDKAIEELADTLHRRYEPRAVPTTPVEDTFPGQKGWDWLSQQPTERVTHLNAFVLGLVDLMRLVAGPHQVTLFPDLLDAPPDLAVHPIALRQMLLNLLQVAIHHAGHGQVTLQTVCHASFVQFHIQSIPGDRDPAGPTARQEQESNLLRIAAHLARLSGGRLEVQEPRGQFTGTLTLPAVEGISILVIDDHPEMIELLQRYCIGTRYQLTGINDPEKALEMVAATTPRIIVMDVMMPKVDGWEMLGRLRSHPLTAQVPVIILTILAQEELALSLGAHALVLKPVTQERFLAALGAVFASLNSDSR